jgi:hypothetical protein
MLKNFIQSMDSFQYFLESNINQINSENAPKKYRHGLYNSSYLELNPDVFTDTIFKSRFLYIRNLCLSDPEPFYIPDELSKFEKALMLVSLMKSRVQLKCLTLNLHVKLLVHLLKRELAPK